MDGLINKWLSEVMLNNCERGIKFCEWMVKELSKMAERAMQEW